MADCGYLVAVRGALDVLPPAAQAAALAELRRHKDEMARRYADPVARQAADNAARRSAEDLGFKERGVGLVT